MKEEKDPKEDKKAEDETEESGGCNCAHCPGCGDPQEDGEEE